MTLWLFFFSLSSDPEQKCVLLCYEQLRSVLELSLPSCFQASVCRSGECSSEISYTPGWHSGCCIDTGDITRGNEALTLNTPPCHQLYIDSRERTRGGRQKTHHLSLMVLCMLTEMLLQFEKWCRFFLNVTLLLHFFLKKYFVMDNAALKYNIVALTSLILFHLTFCDIDSWFALNPNSIFVNF